MADFPGRENGMRVFENTKTPGIRCGCREFFWQRTIKRRRIEPRKKHTCSHRAEDSLFLASMIRDTIPSFPSKFRVSYRKDRPILPSV